MGKRLNVRKIDKIPCGRSVFALHPYKFYGEDEYALHFLGFCNTMDMYFDRRLSTCARLAERRTRAAGKSRLQRRVPQPAFFRSDCKERANVMTQASSKVAVIMGSDSDLPVVGKAIDTLKSLGIPVEAHVMSAHRTPDKAASFASTAAENGFGVIIAAAGKAAHLAGVLAAHTVLPVIGIPVKSSTLDGLDALLSTVQMPSGIPVATVAIDGAENAALLAAQMLALSDEGLRRKLLDKKADMASGVEEKDRRLAETLGEKIL